MPKGAECALYVGGEWVHDASPEQIERVLAEDAGAPAGDFVWVSLDHPDGALLESFRDQLHLHELAAEDMVNAHQRPKLEQYDHSLFLVLRTGVWNAAERRIDVGETHVSVGPRHVLTAHHGFTPSGETFRRRCESEPEHPERGPLYALHVIFDTVVDEWAPVVEALEDLVEGLEEQLFAEEVHRDLIRDVFMARTLVGEARAAVSPLVEISHRFAQSESVPVPEPLRPYFRDVQDHVLRLSGRLEELRDLAAAAVQTHVALVSLRQNEITKRLASWAALVAVPTLVTGVYGMNFRHLPGLSSPLALIAVATGTLAISAALLLAFRRAGWL